MKRLVGIISVILLSMLQAGCGTEAEEAKKLGFSSVQEMNEIHAKGWHTKARYEEDNWQQLGFSSLGAMRESAKDKKEALPLENKSKPQGKVQLDSEHIRLVATEIVPKAWGGCDVRLEAENKTKLNFPELILVSVAKDAQGNILGKYPYTTFLGLTPGVKIEAKHGAFFNEIPCQRIKSITLTVDGSTDVDGNRLWFDNALLGRVSFFLKADNSGAIDLSTPGGALSSAGIAIAPRASPKLNLLERVLDPINGGIKVWDEFVDRGGLNANNAFHGLFIKKINVQWGGKSDKLKIAIMYIDKDVSPSDIRASLSKACGVSESQWKYQSRPVISGQVSGAGIECSYIEDSGSQYELVLRNERAE